MKVFFIIEEIVYCNSFNHQWRGFAHHRYLAVNPGPVGEDSLDHICLPLLTHGAKLLDRLRDRTDPFNSLQDGKNVCLREWDTS